MNSIVLRINPTTYADNKEAPPLLSDGRNFSFWALYAMGLGVDFSGLALFLAAMSAIMSLGAFSILPLKAPLPNRSFQGMSSN